MFSSSERMRRKRSSTKWVQEQLVDGYKSTMGKPLLQGGGLLAFGSYMETMWCGSNIKKWLTSKDSQRVDFVPNLVYRPMDDIIGLPLWCWGWWPKEHLRAQGFGWGNGTQHKHNCNFGWEKCELKRNKSLSNHMKSAKSGLQREDITKVTERELPSEGVI